ncbi:putative methyltransferase [Helianthus anomalus]
MALVDILHMNSGSGDSSYANNSLFTTPHFQVCLNDLFGNDFNNVFKLLPNFYKTLRKCKGEQIGPCFVSVVPGSFYGRFFPDESLHLIHSSYSVHWLSQGLVRESDINSFNLPFYFPHEDELRSIIEADGSFCDNSSFRDSTFAFIAR